MKKVLFVFLLSTPVFATNFVKLDMHLNLNGKEFKPAMIVKYGKAAKVSTLDKEGNGIEMNVVASKHLNKDLNAQKAIKLDVAISEVTNNKAKLVSKPRIISLVGKNAQITQESDSSKLSLDILTSEVK